MQKIILTNLLNNESYSRRVLPFLKEEYFDDAVEKKLFEKIKDFVEKYNNLPTQQTLLVDIESDTKLSENVFKGLCDYCDELDYNAKNDEEWLIEKTEKFCKDQSLHRAILRSIEIIDGKDKEHTRDALPKILSDALAVSFDTNIGHDFIENSEERYEFYHTKEDRIPFDLEYFNTITKGGLPRKTLNVLLAGTGVGKTLAMTHMAAANLSMGKNVLYITLEMAEERIAERIDANLLNVPINELETIEHQLYTDKITRLKKKTVGKLIIKEYPTASVGSGHFRHLMNELRLKKNFETDIIYIDYLNICASSRIRNGSNVNSYSYIKAIAEEIRGLAVEMNVPIVSATQLNRSGYTNSDPGLEDTSESFALPATVDFMCALITSEALESLSQIMVKQLKNRYNDPTVNKRFVVGVDRSRMRLYDVEQTAQDVMDDTPVMDNSAFGSRYNEEESMQWTTKKAGRKDFSNLFS